MEIKNKVIVITGGAGGIGYILAIIAMQKIIKK